MLKSSDQDKIILDGSYLETQIFSLIKVDIVQLIKMKAMLTKHFHIQPTEIDKMPMWEYEMYIIQLNELIKEENENQKKEMDKHHVGEYMQMARPKNIQNMMQNPIANIPKMQSMGDMKGLK